MSDLRLTISKRKSKCVCKFVVFSGDAGSYLLFEPVSHGSGVVYVDNGQSEQLPSLS